LLTIRRKWNSQTPAFQNLKLGTYSEDSNMKNLMRTTIVLVVLHIAGLAILIGQAITGGIFGSVTDISGKMVPGAQVTITNESTGISILRTTDHSGNYIVDQLPVGAYTVTAAAPGFSTTTTSGIGVNIGAQVRVDSKLRVGSVSETIEVAGEDEALQTAGSQVSNTISQETIDALPVASRDPLTLTLLSPTVVQRGSSNVSAVDEPYLGTNIPTIAGGRGEGVNFTVSVVLRPPSLEAV
jgi:Carboxypeptidase regulatory-like domain